MSEIPSTVDAWTQQRVDVFQVRMRGNMMMEHRLVVTLVSNVSKIRTFNRKVSENLTLTTN